jgi:hypothetical protein
MSVKSTTTGTARAIHARLRLAAAASPTEH